MKFDLKKPDMHHEFSTSFAFMTELVARVQCLNLGHD
jgi:hypothetical protein